VVQYFNSSYTSAEWVGSKAKVGFKRPEKERFGYTDEWKSASAGLYGKASDQRWSTDIYSFLGVSPLDSSPLLYHFRGYLEVLD